MPKKQIKNSFNSGEQSEYLTGRTDLAKYFTGCSRLINGSVLTYGGVEKRPGTLYRAAAKGENRVIAFEFSVSDTHVLEFGVNYMRVFKDGAQAVITKASISTDWATATTYSVNDTVTEETNWAGTTGYVIGDRVFDSVGGVLYYECNEAHTSQAVIGDDIGKWDVVDKSYFVCSAAHTSATETIGTPAEAANWVVLTESPLDEDDLIYELHTPFDTIAEIKAFHTTQSADVMYIASNDTHPQKISRFGDTNWTIEDVPFSGGPFLDENTDDDLTLTFTHDEVAFDAPHYHLVGATGTLTSTGHTPFLAEHVGSIWELKSTRTDDVTVTQVVVGTSLAIPIKGTFSVDAMGFPTSATFATLTLQRKEGVGEWQDFRAFTSAVAYTAEELFDDASYRLVLAGASISSAVLTAQEQTQLGAVHIDSFTNPSSVEATVVNDVYHSHETEQAVTGLDNGGTGSASGDVNVRIVDHGYITGNRVFFDSITDAEYLVLNNDGADDTTFQITRIDDDNFTLNDTDGTIDRTGPSEVTSGVGNVQRLSAITTTSMWAEGSWSGVRGYPRTLTFHEDRLWWASTTNNPQTMWGSKTAEYENYLAGIFANDALVFTLNDNDVSQIQWLASRTMLLIGTAGKEYSLSASDPDNPITPDDVKVRNQSAYGSSGIQPVILNDALFYVQRAKRRLRGMQFDLQSASLKSFDSNRLNNTIFESPPVYIAAQKTTEGVIYAIRTDGTLAVMTYEPLEEVTGWARSVTGALSQAGFFPVDGFFESVCVTSRSGEDRITFSVRRTINSNTVRYIEEFALRTTTSMDESVLMDSAVLATSGNDPQRIVCASDTVRCGSGLSNSGPCGGVLS